MRILLPICLPVMIEHQDKKGMLNITFRAFAKSTIRSTEKMVLSTNHYDFILCVFSCGTEALPWLLYESRPDEKRQFSINESKQTGQLCNLHA